MVTSRAEARLARRQERTQIGWTVRRGIVHALQIERLVCVRHHVAKARGPDQRIGKGRLDDTRLLKPAERVGVAGRRPHVKGDAGARP